MINEQGSISEELTEDFDDSPVIQVEKAKGYLEDVKEIMNLGKFLKKNANVKIEASGFSMSSLR